MIYLIIYLIIVFFLIAEQKVKINKICFDFIFLILLFLTIFRNYVGTDYGTYVNIYTKYNNLISPSKQFLHLEIGFKYMIKVLKMLTNNYLYLFALMGCLTSYFLYKAILKYSKYKFFSLYIYVSIFYIGYQFSGIRQALVMTFFLYITPVLLERRMYQFFVVGIIGGLFHKSGNFLISNLFFKKIRIYKKYKYLILILILILVLKLKIFSFFKGYIPKLNSYSIKYMNEINFFNIIQRLMILWPIIVYLSKIKRVKKFYNIFNIYLGGFIVYFVFGFEYMFATRINMYFRILEVILIPFLLSKIKLRSNRLILQSYYLSLYTCVFLKEIMKVENKYKLIHILDLFK